jgi:hypothetical protein
VGRDLAKDPSGKTGRGGRAPELCIGVEGGGGGVVPPPVCVWDVEEEAASTRRHRPLSARGSWETRLSDCDVF